MSETPLRRRRRAVSRRAPGLMIADAAFCAVLCSISALALWPIYDGLPFVVAAVAAFVLALAVAAVGARRGWSPLVLAATTIATYLVMAVPLTMPSALTSVEAAVRGVAAVAVAPVTGWKDLLTLDLPLGDYHATLAPVFFLQLVVGVGSLSLMWRAQRLWFLGPPLALVPVAVGVVFGSSALSAPAQLGPVWLIGPREMFIGVAAVVTTVAFFVWRSATDRRRAMRIADDPTRPRAVRRSPSGRAGRIGVAVSMIVIAAVAGVVVTPLAVADRTRDVLRTQTDPRLEPLVRTSPLSGYRSYFSDDLFDRVLFDVEAPAGVDRIRLAALGVFDGQLQRIVDVGATGYDRAATFVRVPSALGASLADSTTRTSVTIAAYDQPWLPLAGSVHAIAFDDAPALADGFFYNEDTGTGIEVAPLEPGARYRFSSTIDSSLPPVAALQPPGSPAIDGDVVPPALTEWMRGQQAGRGGAALATLVDRLRARGYLSHGLTIDPGATPRWLDDRGGAEAFQPSRAGHSSDRIEQLFASLLDREADVGGSDARSLVAAVGDDEQFAVAAALIADRLGFPARVVLGVRLRSDEPLPVCDDGTCRGGDIAAWVEVQDISGMWVPFDVTPQDDAPPLAADQQRNDPENPTEVDAETAEIVPPVDANPSDVDENDEPDPPAENDLTALWAVLRVTAVSMIGLLLVAAPALVILLIKTLRRRKRRHATDPQARVTGGWQEYVDVAVDHGHAAPRTATRVELAHRFGADDPSTGGLQLATWADRVVFDDDGMTPGLDDEVWRIVAQERARMDEPLSRWQRSRARLSLRSVRARGR